MIAMPETAAEIVREDGKVPRAIALEVARDVVSVLRPRTTRLIVAGSLRRRKAFVSDVEILFVPRMVTAPDPHDLLGGTCQVNAAEEAIAALLEAGLLARRPKSDGSFTWGAQNKLGVHVASELAVDLFTATDRNWWNYLVCRTGGAENNVRICNAASARGWKWNPYGDGFSRAEPDGRIKEQRIVSSEREVFEFVGLPYLEPWER